MSVLGQARLLARALAAYRVGAQARIPGLRFDRFGRRVGLELLARREGGWLEYLLHPVDIVRYFEFEWALAALPPGLRRCLDVSSPRLFTYLVARRAPEARIAVFNPDREDASTTRRIAGALRLANLEVRVAGFESLDPDARFDAAWSLSVVEHVASARGDADAITAVHRRLEPGGTFLLSVPVARTFRVEYRDADVYGTQPPQRDGRFFFQRVYDEASIAARLVGAAPWRRAEARWFGETTPGWFAEYERRWSAEGLPFVVEDPRFVAEHFREYPRWADMPGDGVCGLALTR
jgi:SAM-dependent methyltransferase